MIPQPDGGEQGLPANRLNLPEILASPGDFKMLREHIRSINGNTVGNVAVLGFRALQLYRIAKMQGRLVKLQNKLMQEREEESLEDDKNDDEADGLLQKYADAIRNYETLSQSIRGSRDAKYEFLGTNEGFSVEERSDKSTWWAWHGDLTAGSSHGNYGIGPLGFRELDKKRLIARNDAKASASRFFMALFGGVSLIIPMLIMALAPGRTMSLATTSIATVLFSLVVALFSTDASGKDVLASTAAYAAVLVVFVGTSLEPEK